MEHVVFFPAHDGSPAFRRVGSLEEAVRLVEHLRNIEGVAEVSVHHLAEVPLAFKAYYKVEMPTAEGAAPNAEQQLAVAQHIPAQAVEQAPVQVIEQPTAEAVAAEGVTVQAGTAEEIPALASSNGRPADGPSSLGFFAS